MPVLSTKHLFCPPDLISFSPNHATGKHKSIFVKLITVEDIYFVFIIYILIMQKKAQTKKALILANNDRDLGTAWNHRWNWTVLLQPISNRNKTSLKVKRTLLVARYFRRQYNIQTEFNKSGELIIFEATTGTGNLSKSMYLTDPELLHTVLHHSKQVVMNDHARCMTFHVTSFSIYLTYTYEIYKSHFYFMLYKSKKHLCYTNQEKKPNIYVWSIHCDINIYI